jgi:hypothetical protein
VKKPTDVRAELGLKPGTSLELLQALGILTREQRINQDSRRKLKQVQHLLQFITPLLDGLAAQGVAEPHLIDFGAGKSYLGFMLWDAWFAGRNNAGKVTGIDIRADLVATGERLARQFGFGGMRFAQLNTADMKPSAELGRVDVVSALHACDTATDDAIAFALQAQAQHIVLVPCCQAELASSLRQRKAANSGLALTELFRHAHHTREFGSQLTNVLRGLRLEAHGYRVSVTELVGWEHSLKNELIVASRHPDVPKNRARTRLQELLTQFGLDRDPQLLARFA